MTREDRIFEAFYRAALFLKERVENDGWFWRNNYLREHARVTKGLNFSNDISPVMYQRLRDTYPSLAPYIDGANSKQRDNGELRLGL